MKSFQTKAGTGLIVALMVVWGIAGADRAAGEKPDELARRMLRASGVKGGLVVHVGCGDGRLTVALRANDSFLVHGLDQHRRDVEEAREYVRSRGLYGPVSIDRWNGKHLPYADNLVNLLVVEEKGKLSDAEIMRVLAPRGAACVKAGGGWSRTVKPRPEDTDEWTHFLHDASGNAVAHDTVVAPPRGVQWIAEPRHTRSHEHTPSINALVSTGGRIFYVADRAPIASILEPPEWRLVARDAHNGLLLWKRPVGPWISHLHNWGRVRSLLQRRLVAVGDRVYVTLGFHAPVSVLDATTGDTLQTYEQTRGAEEIVYHRGVLLVAVRAVTEERVAQLEKWQELARQKGSPLFSRETAEPLEKRHREARRGAERSILALDADTGRVLWRKQPEDLGYLRPTTLCAVGNRALYQDGKEVTCLDLETGRELWSAESVQMRVTGEGRVVCANGDRVTVLSLQTGESLWSKPTVLTQIRDAFIINGSLWLGGFEKGTDWRGRRSPAWGPYFATERDLATGELLQHVQPENPGHHHRCYRNKATERYILSGRRGIEFVNLQTGDVLWHSWVRGVCRYGVMPCNGLIYAPPHACACYVAAKLEGFHALTHDSGMGDRNRRGRWEDVERGPAYSEEDPIGASSSSATASKGAELDEEWPTYRRNARRCASTPSPVPAGLQRKWQADVGGRLSAPTVAAGKLLVASVDQHRVCAINARSGEPEWDFTAGARVDSPPTIHGGRAIFGCRDGYVYSVRAADGALDWRLQAAGPRRLITARGQLESARPLHGSVLVRDGVACFTTGRSSYLGGGIDLYRVRPETGEVVSKTTVYSPDPETGRQPAQSGPAYMPGARWGILSGDDEHIYLRDTVFDTQGEEQSEGKPHLFALTAFLDDSWAHRSYWCFGTRCSISTGCSRQDKNLVFGRLLAFDDGSIYGYGRARLHWSNQLQDGPYRTFASNRSTGKQEWTKRVPITVRALVAADDVIFVAGPRRVGLGASPGGENSGRTESAHLWALSAEDGEKLAEYELEAPPVWDGMAVAYGHLYVCTAGGRVLCMGPRGEGK